MSTPTQTTQPLHDTAPPSTTIRPPGFWRGTWLIATLELRQRLRSRMLWILAIVWFAIIGIVTLASWWFIVAMAGGGDGTTIDAFPLFSVIVYFVLLFGTLVAPAISAGSIGSERAGGTLATTQVTLVSTWSILLGKALAAWITGVAFLVVATPFVILSLLLGRARPWTLLLALIGLIVQIGLFTAIGVGLSAMITSQVFAIVTAYLIVAALSIGTLIAFGLVVGTSTETRNITYSNYTDSFWQRTDTCNGDQECLIPQPGECISETSKTQISHPERFWWILTMNPYVVLADIATSAGKPPTPSGDLFDVVSSGVRLLQHPENSYLGQQCTVGKPAVDGAIGSPFPPESTDRGQPYWWVGLLLQSVLAAGALGGGYARLRTPAKSIPKGTRVA